MRNRATFTILVSLPDEYGADQLEVVTEKLIAFIHTGNMQVLNAVWACPTIGRKSTPTGPVLAFRREE